VYRFDWEGHPAGRPAVAVGENTIYVSWNGATEVKRWEVLAGSDIGHLAPVRNAAKTGFETAIPVQANADFYAVRALDANGAVLGTSKLVARKKS
jgi:hypothetical protein